MKILIVIYLLVNAVAIALWFRSHVRSVEEIVEKIAMFPNDDVLPEDMLIDYDRIRVGDIYKLITKAKEEERESINQLATNVWYAEKRKGTGDREILMEVLKTLTPKDD
jgi:hypothetical protein